MGSFSSKIRSSTSDDNEIGRRPSKLDSKQSGVAQSANSAARTDATSEDKSRAGSSSEGQPSETKVVQSFGWLVETPVVLNPTVKELKNKAKTPATADGKGKANNINVMTYSNGKYLKSAEIMSIPSNTKPKQGAKQQVHTSSASASWKGKHAVDKLLKQMNSSGQKNVNEDASPCASPGVAYRAGFGVIRKKDSVAKGQKSENCTRERQHGVKGKSPASGKGKKALIEL